MELKSTDPRPETSRRELAEAQALLSALTEFSARGGHDLLGPLNQAGSLLSLFVKRYRNQLDAEADQLLEFLQRASSTIQGVVAGVREYLAIAGTAPRFEAVDLNASLASSLEPMEKAISECGAVIESDSLPVVSADAAQMVTVFGILIGNSIKFRRPETLLRIRISFRSAGEERVIAVADNGIGIDPESSETPFLPFQRLNGKEYPGAGLGLAMAKLIIELHGGKIGINPVPSGGTCIRFTVLSPDDR
jgi:light-regulated signal transduction histidine kinase (bacteriophytochrome)